MLTVTSKGFSQTHDLLKYVDQNAVLVGRTTIRTSSPLPYAGPINRGYFLTGPRAGQSARAAGPALMFEKGAEVVAQKAPAVLAAAIVKPPPATQNALTHLAREQTKAVRGFTPRRSGDLQESISSRTEGR